MIVKVNPSFRYAVFGGLVSTLALVAGAPGLAQDCALIGGVLPAECERENQGLIVTTPVEPNQERGDEEGSPSGFSITLDGQKIAGENREVIAGSPSPAGDQRGQDIALDAADVQVKYDGIRAERRLNVLTSDLRTEFRAGDPVTFRASTSYARWIDRAEVRIIDLRRGFGRPETIILPIQPDGTVNWTMPAGGEGDYAYVLRVYDSSGRFDETAPATIARRESPVDPELNGPVIAAGEGEDRTSLRNIPIAGGTVTVSGSGLPPGAAVAVMGRSVSVDDNGRFVTELVLPAGEQNVTVALAAPNAEGVTLTREIDIPRNDWYATGLADFTIGRRGESFGSGESYTSGRLAFYAKGVFGGNYRATAAFDSGEDELENLFDDVLTKDPRSVLKRIDPDDLYPTYGDDSTIVDDAPTSGKIYVKIEEGDSHLMWGDFENEIDGSAYLSASRELYGAQGVYRSPAATVYGDRRFELTAYAARPDSLPQRDELRGTGGSVYLLQRRDLVPGSEKVKVEITDPVTGRVIETRTLSAAEDYRIDYFQGTIILNDPLTSSVSDGGLISDGPTGDLVANLVVQYEYVPVATSIDGSALGGRAEAWLPGDMIRLGVTAMDETTDRADLNAVAADVRLQFSQNSFLEAEIAESRGVGFGRSISTDGGFTWVDIAGGGSEERARATRIEGELDLADVSPNMSGSVTAYRETKEAGFTTLSDDISADQTVWGLGVDAAISDRLGIIATYEDFESDDGSEREQGEIVLAYAINDMTLLEVGAQLTDQDDPGDPDDTGRRTDLGFRLTRDLGADQSIYLFGQGTVDREGTIRRNNRLGVGGRFNLSERTALEAEVSDGTNGLGARALLDYRPTDSSRFYAGYELDPNREIAGTTLNGDHQGTFILGAERKVNDNWSYFAENNYDLFGNRRSLTEAYGVTYTPSEVWEYSANLETGRVSDDNDGDVDRTAIGLGAKYDSGEGIDGSVLLEYRLDDEENAETRDRETWAFVGAYGNQLNPDWRFVASLDALISESDQSDFLDGRYIEASLGYAYRPVANDRWNVLARYTYLYDLPGAEQVFSDGDTAGAKQRSHIFSVDAIYEVDENWEIGGKLAYRKGETAERESNDFSENDAGLFALRATYDIDQLWEVSGEGRLLILPDADTKDYGALLTVYRSFGNNAKIGLGYNFGSFSDDLRDTTLDDEGIFLNLQAKF